MLKHDPDYFQDKFYSLCNDFYSFAFEPVQGETKKTDIRIKYTINDIVNNWFEGNNQILYFICSNKDGKSKKRRLAFEKWIDTFKYSSGIEQKYFYSIQEINDVDEILYAGIIYKHDYKKREELEGRFHEIVDFIQNTK